MKRKIGIGVLISLVVLSTLTIACATTDSVFDSRDEEKNFMVKQSMQPELNT